MRKKARLCIVYLLCHFHSIFVFFLLSTGSAARFVCITCHFVHVLCLLICCIASLSLFFSLSPWLSRSIRNRRWVINQRQHECTHKHTQRKIHTHISLGDCRRQQQQQQREHQLCTPGRSCASLRQLTANEHGSATLSLIWLIYQHTEWEGTRSPALHSTITNLVLVKAVWTHLQRMHSKLI